MSALVSAHQLGITAIRAGCLRFRFRAVFVCVCVCVGSRARASFSGAPSGRKAAVKAN